MGGRSKIKTPKKETHSLPIDRQIEQDNVAPERNPKKQKEKKRSRQPEEDFIHDNLSNKIMAQARKQLEDIEREEKEEEERDAGGGGSSQKQAKRKPSQGRQILLEGKSSMLDHGIEEEYDSDDSDDDDDDNGDNNKNTNKKNAFDEEEGEAELEYDSEEDKRSEFAYNLDKEYEHEEYSDVELDEEDEQALNAFMNPFGGQQRSLADMILEKIHDKEAEEQGAALEMLEDDEDERQKKAAMLEEFAPEGIDEKVLQVYRKVGDLLKRYTTGKFPKAFKIIPALSNWEEVLWLTRPDTWSPHAMFQATRLFASNLNEHMAQRFYVLVLLPRVRDDIQEHKRLHHALYQALRKATFKPGAWFKGILLPLCESKTCTLREAVVLSSVLAKTSVPALHSAAVLMKLSELEYAGTTSFFIRVLLDKKYALPYRVVDALVENFLRFANEDRTLPVVWHQSFLCFVQRYKHELSKEQKKRLSKLASAHQNHYLISPEIVRELANSDTSRGDKRMDVHMKGIHETKPKQGVAREFTLKTKSGARLQVEDFRNMPPIVLQQDMEY
ncbi:bystin [Bathycoccus prasinos]|jgi:essential nuclear protein 1|uniref:Bystin n=1 Tax=Bathycoccus prasinos TaxID=41875 RepID=K8EQT5_9CHLO|nr:bystin [Bathycoccus prasinos]CCO20304.1 bystin [Bathycoccus prasinos]|tara:strand:- start:723 stop:2393 length:1671 start_codon:yes stop_codon:yes gene_type:complete|mmetsp:Transcript_209/g.704  ORF Transcript_209/g.704 Transcript_209/m.704 type:complete len:557 (+) Transcript_209:175-1845(+)|eukprot:XP_007508687.1 bystin [Bathycoccus prasinos]